MSAVKTLTGIITFVGCIAIIITLAIVLSRDRNDCGIISQDIRITEFTFCETEDGVVVTWPKPAELWSCHPRYEVTYKSTQGTFSTTVELESVTIPDQTFCFEFDINVRLSAATSNIAGGRTSYHDVRPISVQFSVPAINPSVIIITWTHPNYKWCLSFDFMVKYETESETQVVNSTKSEATFNFEYFMASSLTIWPINPNNGHLLSATTIDATQYPTTFESTNTSVISYDDRLELLWTTSTERTLCEFSYRADFITDLDRFTIHTVEPNITLSREFFCFSVAVVIDALVGDNAIRVLNAVWTYGMHNVTDIDVTASSEEGTLTATWASNPLEKQCNIIYEATFESENQFRTYRVSQPTATSELFYCVNTTVSVKAIYKEIVGTPNSVIFAGENPSSLAPIDNIFINSTETATVVSWESPESVAGCVGIYLVTATNEAGTIQCEGTTSCELNLSNLCPSTEFVIRPTPPIEGEERTTQYNCT